MNETPRDPKSDNEADSPKPTEWSPVRFKQFQEDSRRQAEQWIIEQGNKTAREALRNGGEWSLSDDEMQIIDDSLSDYI